MTALETISQRQQQQQQHQHLDLRPEPLHRTRSLPEAGNSSTNEGPANQANQFLGGSPQSVRRQRNRIASCVVIGLGVCGFIGAIAVSAFSHWFAGLITMAVSMIIVIIGFKMFTDNAPVTWLDHVYENLRANSINGILPAQTSAPSDNPAIQRRYSNLPPQYDDVILDAHASRTSVGQDAVYQSSNEGNDCKLPSYESAERLPPDNS